MTLANAPIADLGPTPRKAARAAFFVLAALLAAVTVFPLIWMFASAIKPRAEIYSLALWPEHPTLDNFAYVFTQTNFLRWIFNTAFVSAVVSLAGLWFHSMAGYAFARLRFPGRDQLFFGLFCTYLVSLPVIIVPLFLMVRYLSWTDSYAGLIVPAIFNFFGIFLLRQFYLDMPIEIEEAALIDGAGYFKLYWYIVLPVSRPILSTLFVLFFLANWNAFLWPLIITTNPDLFLVQVGIKTFRGQYESAQNYVMAASALIATPTLLMFFIFQKQLIASIKTSGIKG